MCFRATWLLYNKQLVCEAAFYNVRSFFFFSAPSYLKNFSRERAKQEELRGSQGNLTKTLRALGWTSVSMSIFIFNIVLERKNSRNKLLIYEKMVYCQQKLWVVWSKLIYTVALWTIPKGQAWLKYQAGSWGFSGCTVDLALCNGQVCGD